MIKENIILRLYYLIIATEGIEPSTFGLWARHANLCATSLFLVLQKIKIKNKDVETPGVGLEPTATRLKVLRSTN